MKVKIPRPKVFYLHFNRIAMQRKDPRVWSVRTSKGCFHAERVVVAVPVASTFRAESRQPRAFFKGMGFGTWLEVRGADVFLLHQQPEPTNLDLEYTAAITQL
jgi:glycine/D-amino acid oxidase-like deaminating enzyme